MIGTQFQEIEGGLLIIDVFKFLPSSSVFSTIDNFSNIAMFLALLHKVSFATSSTMLADSPRN